MSDERRWKLTGVYGSPVALRLADGHGPQLPGPDEEIEVVEVAALVRVKRERDNLAATLRNAQERAQAWEATARKWADAANERDALRAQVEALTEAADDVLDQRNSFPTDLYRGHAYHQAMDALAAARDAAAANPPDQPDS
jgi:hypothetical protein